MTSGSVLLGVLLLLPPQEAAGQTAAPKILFDTSPRAVEFQLRRLSNAELAQVDRRDDDPTYRPVYYALLTRKGLGREYFDEALAALRKLDKASASGVLLEALSRIPADDAETSERLLRVLFAQPADALRQERELFARAAEGAGAPPVLRGAYGGLMLADGTHERAWKQAAAREGHLPELLRSVPLLGPSATFRPNLFEPIAALLATPPDAATRGAALAALGATRPDAEAFRLLAREFLASDDPAVRAAAIGSLQRVPEDAWPRGDIEPVVRAIVGAAGKAPPQRRTEPDMLEAMALAERLAGALPPDSARALRRDLRALGVQVVQIRTIPEQMAFDVRWFTVQAGRLVQIVLSNPDAMSHNLVVTQPGALREVGIAASSMTMPSDPKAKPYVPATPMVLEATRLLNWGETERLSFRAPKQPGEYPFVCTFPGHWVRMYGVMLVVEDLEAWEAAPTVPTDPMTNQPFPSQRH